MSRSLKVGALVTICMGTLLFAAMQHAGTLRAERLLHELPSDARAVVRIDTAALQRTAAAKTLLAAFVTDEPLREIELLCGLDPLQVLSEVIVWVRGPDAQPFQSIGLMLRGSSVSAETLAACHRALVEGRGGSVVRLDGPGGPLLASRDQGSAVAVLDEHTIATGSVRTVAEAMSVRRGAAPALVERDRMAMLWRLVNVRSSIAAVLELPAHWMSALESLSERFDGPFAMQGLDALGLSVASGSTQTVKMYIEVSDAQLASRDPERIRAWLASPPRSIERPWRDVLQSGRVKADGRRIELTLDVSSLSTAP